MVNMIDDAVTTCEDDFHDVTKRTSFNPYLLYTLERWQLPPPVFYRK